MKEQVSLMEPMVLSASSRHRAKVADLAVELAAVSTGFRRSLPQGIFVALADLVRSMNCYYSNLIEGHNTHPIDIERALKQDYSADPKKRDLQLEAEAHIAVQAWIDEGGLRGSATDEESIREIHQRFCERLPDELLSVENPDTGEWVKVKPGCYRHGYVSVGRHVSISAEAIPPFLQRFEHVYGMLGTSETIIASAAAHHRLLWIHPFPDGNGRVARLMSHAMLSKSIDTGGVWSIARGLARNEQLYKAHLMSCDSPRKGELDGRGNLSEEALAEFTIFFLETCLDQVTFMENLAQPERLHRRVLTWAEREISQKRLPDKAGKVLEIILYRGEIARGEVVEILDTSERTARRTVSALLEYGVLKSETTRAPLKLTFPATIASEWMPGLFPEN